MVPVVVLEELIKQRLRAIAISLVTHNLVCVPECWPVLVSCSSTAHDGMHACQNVGVSTMFQLLLEAKLVVLVAPDGMSAGPLPAFLLRPGCRGLRALPHCERGGEASGTKVGCLPTAKVARPTNGPGAWGAEVHMCTLVHHYLLLLLLQ